MQVKEPYYKCDKCGYKFTRHRIPVLDGSDLVDGEEVHTYNDVDLCPNDMRDAMEHILKSESARDLLDGWLSKKGN